MSIATTRPSRPTRRASGIVRRPGPQPTSSTLRPGRSSSRSMIVRALLLLASGLSSSTIQASHDGHGSEARREEKRQASPIRITRRTVPRQAESMVSTIQPIKHVTFTNRVMMMTLQNQILGTRQYTVRRQQMFSRRAGFIFCFGIYGLSRYENNEGRLFYR